MDMCQKSRSARENFEQPDDYTDYKTKPALENIIENEEIERYEDTLEKRSEIEPFDVNLYKKIIREEMSYLEVVKEMGEFNFVNVLSNYGKVERIILPDSMTGFKDNKKGHILSEDEAMERAINILKKRVERTKDKLILMLHK